MASRGIRNNNPGNVEFGSFTQKHGALSGDPRFAIFPTYEAGRNAKRELIFQGKNYTNLSLSQAIARYAPPSENNTNAYIAGVLGAVGGIEKFMKDYVTSEQDAILNAMQRIEGWVVGRVELIEKPPNVLKVGWLVVLNLLKKEPVPSKRKNQRRRRTRPQAHPRRLVHLLAAA